MRAHIFLVGALVLTCVQLNATLPAPTTTKTKIDTEQKGLEWRDQNVDKSGCVDSKKVEDPNGPDHCQAKIELAIRPLTIGTFNAKKTREKISTWNLKCCYDWETLGNR